MDYLEAYKEIQKKVRTTDADAMVDMLVKLVKETDGKQDKFRFEFKDDEDEQYLKDCFYSSLMNVYSWLEITTKNKNKRKKKSFSHIICEIVTGKNYIEIKLSSEFIGFALIAEVEE